MLSKICNRYYQKIIRIYTNLTIDWVETKLV